jgi:hypothetical protein
MDVDIDESVIYRECLFEPREYSSDDWGFVVGGGKRETRSRQPRDAGATVLQQRLGLSFGDSENIYDYFSGGEFGGAFR